MPRCLACLQPATDRHHAVPRSICSKAVRDNPENLIDLCHRCHMDWHAGRGPIWRQLLPADTWDFIEAHTTERWRDYRYPSMSGPHKLP